MTNVCILKSNLIFFGIHFLCQTSITLCAFVCVASSFSNDLNCVLIWISFRAVHRVPANHDQNYIRVKLHSELNLKSFFRVSICLFGRTKCKKKKLTAERKRSHSATKKWNKTQLDCFFSFPQMHTTNRKQNENELGNHKIVHFIGQSANATTHILSKQNQIGRFCLLLVCLCSNGNVSSLRSWYLQNITSELVYLFRFFFLKEKVLLQTINCRSAIWIEILISFLAFV